MVSLASANDVGLAVDACPTGKEYGKLRMLNEKNAYDTSMK